MMGRTLHFYGFKPHYTRLLFFKDFLFKVLIFFANFCWVSLSTCVLHVFGSIFRIFLSYFDKNSGKFGSDFAHICENPKKGVDESENQVMGSDQIVERQILNLDYEVKSVSNANTSMYQFYSGNNACSFIEEPGTMSFTVQEMFVVSSNGQDKNNFLGKSVDKQQLPECVPVLLDVRKSECGSLILGEDGNSVEFCDILVNDDSNSNSSENVDCCELNGSNECNLSFEEQEALSFTQLYFCEKGETVNVENRCLSEHEVSDQAVSSLLNSDDFWAVIHHFDDSCGDFDSDYDEIASYRTLSEVFELDTPIALVDEMMDFHEDSPKSLDDIPLDQTSLFFNDVNSLSDTEEPPLKDELSYSNDEHYQEKNGVYVNKEGCDGEDTDKKELDVVFEQKELIRQMKKEMRHLKSSGLPIILEESESPRVEDDLRPLKFKDKIGYKDCMDQIQAVYKGYLDKMKKLDVLSQQTMYGIGLLQLKTQDLFAWNKKISVPIMKTLFVQNFWSSKMRKHEDDPVAKTIKDFQRDLEFVYISHICLSWEILKWQYHKSEELQSYDPEGFHNHNQASGKFQKFQVLLQRFVEDEPFHHGHRVQHYVKSRCDLSNFLEVPLIKDDSISEWRQKGGDGSSIGMLKEVIRATMCVFWEFLRADKDETHAWTQLGIHGVQFDLQDPSNTTLLQEIHSNLQKKAKRLKDIGRSRNCIVKKFQKQEDQRLSQEMLIAQVELRLISRVLHTQRLTTDHLLWCHKKLRSVNLVGRKVYVDSSFVLFSC